MLTVLLAASLLSDSLIAPGSGAAMCQALTPADFTKAGVPVTSVLPSPDVEDDGASVTCGYASTSGNLELDVYFPTPDAKRVEAVALHDSQARYAQTTVPGTDDAQIGDVGGKKPATLLVVRRGTAVLVLGLPQGPHAREQLVALMRIAVGRLRR